MTRFVLIHDSFFNSIRYDLFLLFFFFFKHDIGFIRDEKRKKKYAWMVVIINEDWRLVKRDSYIKESALILKIISVNNECVLL